MAKKENPKTNTSKREESIPVDPFTHSIECVQNALQRIETTQEEIHKTNSLIRDCNIRIKKLVTEEDFAGAAVAKTDRENMETVLEELKKNLRKTIEEANALNEQASETYFKQNPPFKDDVVLTRVTIADPKTHDAAIIYYTDASETVYCTLSGKNFDSEAYHIGDWAFKNGFLVHYDKKTISF